MGIRHSIIVRTLTHAFHFCSWSETIEREHEAKYVEVRLLAISCHTLAIRRIIQVLALVDWYGRASWRNLDPLQSSLPEAPFPIEPYYHLSTIPISKHIYIPHLHIISSQLNPHSRPPPLNKKPHHPRPRRNLHLPSLPSALIHPPLSTPPSLPPPLIPTSLAFRIIRFI